MAWHGTCGLSGLAIRNNDPIIAMMIQREERDTLTPSYPWENWSPATMIVRGTYNEFGDVTLSKKERAKFLLSREEASKALQRVPFPDGEFGYGYVAVEPFALEDEDGEPGFFRQPDDSGFAIWMAHETIFERLKEAETEDRKTWSAVTIGKLSRVTVRRCMAEDRKKRQGGDLFDDGWKDNMELRGAAMRYLRSVIRRAKREPINTVAYRAAAHAWRELFELYEMMSVLRINLHNPSGCGSQNDDVQPYEVRSAAMADHITRFKEWRDN